MSICRAPSKGFPRSQATKININCFRYKNSKQLCSSAWNMRRSSISICYHHHSFNALLLATYVYLVPSKVISPGYLSSQWYPFPARYEEPCHFDAQLTVHANVCEIWQACGDVLTKKKLDAHHRQCQGSSFTCIDCMTHFRGTDFRSHTVR